MEIVLKRKKTPEAILSYSNNSQKIILKKK